MRIKGSLNIQSLVEASSLLIDVDEGDRLLVADQEVVSVVIDALGLVV